MEYIYGKREIFDYLKWRIQVGKWRPWGPSPDVFDYLKWGIQVGEWRPWEPSPDIFDYLKWEIWVGGGRGSGVPGPAPRIRSPGSPDPGIPGSNAFPDNK